MDQGVEPAIPSGPARLQDFIFLLRPMILIPVWTFYLLGAWHGSTISGGSIPRVPFLLGLVSFTATRWGTLLRPLPGFDRTPSAGDCYRFALSRPEVDLCLAGPANRAQLEEALRAVEKGPLDDDETAFLRKVGDHVYSTRDGKGETGFLRR